MKHARAVKMLQSINFPIAPSCIAPYGSWAALAEKLAALGLDGVEGIWDPAEIDDSFPTAMLTGCHLIFYPDWLDFYREDRAALLRKFGSMETVAKAYPGPKPEDLVRAEAMMRWKAGNGEA